MPFLLHRRALATALAASTMCLHCEGFSLPSAGVRRRKVTAASAVAPPPSVLLNDEDRDDLFGFGSGAEKHREVNGGLSSDSGGIDSSNMAGNTLLSLKPDELVELLGGTGRAKMTWNMLREGLDPSDPGPDGAAVDGEASTALSQSSRQPRSLGKAARSAVRDGLSSLPPVVHSTASSDGTRKMLLRLRDGLEVECVLIPMTGSVQHRKSSGEEAEAEEEEAEEEEALGANKMKSKPRRRGNRQAEGHTTLCISSQVGCARGCSFCATGAMGLVRCLDAEEILAQCFHGRREAAAHKMPPLNNIVFMGMGEPLNNPRAVGAAIERLTHDQYGFGFSKTRVTVSTVAPSPEAVLRHASSPSSSLNRESKQGEAAERGSGSPHGLVSGAMLAWSVHAADDATRKLLVPTTRHSMVELREAFREALRSRPSRALRTLMVEVALMDGLNDSPEHAARLAEFLWPMISEDRLKVCVNLIPFNPVQHQPLYRRPTPSAVAAFQDVLRARGVFTFVRTTHGDEEAAACGQLATNHKRQKKGE